MRKIVVVLILLIIITGCNSNKEKESEPAKKIDSLDYEILSNCDIGNFDYSKRGYYIDTLNQPNAPYWYIITMGERNTGGYSIKIKNVEKKEDKVVVTVEEETPSEGAIVTQAFTYPKCCIKFNSGINIEIRNTKGQTFEYIGS